MVKDYTSKELMAIFISRQINDGEYISVGTNLPIPRAGVLLAHFTGCPNLKINMAGCIVNLLGEEGVKEIEFIADPRASKGAEYILPLDFENLSKIDLFFIGGIQIDKHGNTNLIGVGENPKKLKFRGPGSVGISTIASYVKRYFIFTATHNKRIFVEKCDYISSFGWGDGGADSRKKLGIPGGGPEYVITPLCIMDFTEDKKEMRLKHLAPNVSVDDVVKNTGFELIIPEKLEPLKPPKEDEIKILREKIDIRGILRKDD
jgi:glutaconate CoA-transferase subunit B